MDLLLSTNEGTSGRKLRQALQAMGKHWILGLLEYAGCTRLGVCDPPRVQKGETDEVVLRLDEASESELECEDTSCPAVLVGVAYGESARPISAATCLDEAMLS